ncbi:MAG TPA: type II CAAX endopeptidase family protein [Candidatus Udaeobacter sp.]|nr:type II CAAX endopeptidase family protein [Candidatus Udaeobacter sp.]
MHYESLFAASGVVPNAVFSVLSLLYVLASLYVYISLIHQISARSLSGVAANAPARTFGGPEAILAALLILFLSVSIGASVSQPSIQFSAHNLIGNFLLMVFLVLFIVTFLRLRGFDVGSLGGFYRISFLRTLSTGAILLFFAYPLILWSDIITQRLFGGGSSRQNIVEFFSGSRTLQQRVIIIVFAIAVAPVIEEFLFRFFLYNVIKRYLGRLVGVTFSALLFAAAHSHFPSFVPLFVLGSCFAIAYEWTGSLLVAMTMHSLFNSLTLTALAFPEIFSP